MGIRQIALAVGVATFCAAPAVAQASQSGYTEFIRNAQEAEESYIRFEREARDEIAALDAIDSYFILKAPDGSFTELSVDDASAIGDQFLLFRMLGDTEVAQGILNGLSLVPQLRSALQASMTAVTRSSAFQQNRESDIVNLFRDALFQSLSDLTRNNRNEIERRKRDLYASIRNSEGMRDVLGELVDEAVRARSNAPTDSAQAGYISQEGYYVVRKSGAGWIKGGQGSATFSAGYTYFTIWGDEDRTAPSKQYYWEFPIGFDMGRQYADWKADARETSKQACRDLRPLGRVSEPHIWTDGPHYEIVYGPSSSRPPAAQFGSSRVTNGQAGSSRQWQHTYGDIEEVQAVCSGLGVPFSN